jgi:hypothetical protein
MSWISSILDGIGEFGSDAYDFGVDLFSSSELPTPEVIGATPVVSSAPDAGLSFLDSIDVGSSLANIGSNSSSSFSDKLIDGLTSPEALGVGITGIAGLFNNAEQAKVQKQQLEQAKLQQEAELELARRRLELEERALEARLAEAGASGADNTPQIIQALTAASNGTIDALNNMAGAYGASLTRYRGR